MQVYLHYIKHLQYTYYITALQVHDVEMTLYWRLCDFIMSHRRHVPLDVTKKKLSDLENEIYRVQSGVLPTEFKHKLLLSLSAQPDYMWKNWKK